MNKLNQKKNIRPIQAKFLMFLSAVSATGISPFLVYRIIQNDWFMVALDSLIVLGMVLIFYFIYLTNETKYTSIGVVLIAQVGSLVSFYINGGNIFCWIYPAMLSMFYVVKPKTALLTNFGLIVAYMPKLNSVFVTSDVLIILMSILMALIIAYNFASGLRMQETTLKKLASEDYLTKVGNRRALNIKLKEIHRTLKNHDKYASLILLDLDYFKKVNDAHGHLVGDGVLVNLSKLLKDQVNKDATIYRYGGEEFIVICDNKNGKKAFNFAEEFRNIVKNTIDVAGKPITISLGVTEYQKEESIDEWIHRVDLALYQAKNQGRDRTVQT